MKRTDFTKEEVQMKKPGSVWLVVIALGMVMIGSGCTRPPEKEMSEAESAMKAATDAGADKYASAKFNEANNAMADAKTKMAAKDYKGAKMGAQVAKAKFETATSKAAEGKAQMKTEVEGTWNQANTEVTDIEAKLPKMKLKKDEKEKMSQMLAQVKDGLGAAKTAMDSGDIAGAKEKVAAARTSLDEASRMVQEKMPPEKK
jgi:hypothetical protein